MALVRDLRERHDVPHEPGEWIEFRLLSWRELEEAQERRLRRLLEQVREMGGLEALAGAERAGGGEPSPREMYDHGVLLERAIVAWSYDAPVSPETIALLDPVTKEWAVDVVLRLNGPRGREERKNG